MKLDSVNARIILDSRRENTIETTITSGNLVCSASVPCGKSKGEHEAHSFSAERTLDIIEEIKVNLLDREFASLEEFDNFLLDLDGSSDKSKLGVSVTLALSIAFLRLLSQKDQLEVWQKISQLTKTKPERFPLLFFNLINGGLHVAKNFCPLPFQEYLLIPKTKLPSESLEIVYKFIEVLKKEILETGVAVRYGDEGGFIITGDNPETGLEFFQQIVKNNRNEFFDRFYFGLDVASNSLWDQERSGYSWDNGLVKCQWSNKQLGEIYKSFTEKYPLLSIEDPFYQDAWSEWALLNRSLGKKVWLVGDDLTTTNSERIKKANALACANAVLVKPNQIGTLTETFEAVTLAKSFGWKIIVSHRSGETNDPFIADLAFGVGADGLKAGSPLQTERLAKYKRLIEIESSYKELVIG